jgi:DNA-binding NarL/FixJ family response regulator
MSSRVFLADNEDVFRAGMARILVAEDDVSIIGQCDDLGRLYKAAETSRAVITFSSSLGPDLERLVPAAKTSNNPLIAILASGDSPQRYLNQGVQGIIYRDIKRHDLLKCFRSIFQGRTFLQQPKGASSETYETDVVGERVRRRLSRKELQILRLLMRGYKNRAIAEELNNTEQVIKNYLRSIFDKSGTSDRLELVLFTVHHQLLLEAVEAALPCSQTTERADPISDGFVLVPVLGMASLADTARVQ